MCIHKHVCGFVWGANINIIQYVIFQLSQPLASEIQHIIICDPETEEKLFQEHENMQRMSYQIQWKRFLVSGYWHPSQVQRGVTEC